MLSLANYKIHNTIQRQLEQNALKTRHNIESGKKVLKSTE